MSYITVLKNWYEIWVLTLVVIHRFVGPIWPAKKEVGLIAEAPASQSHKRVYIVMIQRCSFMIALILRKNRAEVDVTRTTTVQPIA